MDYIGTFGFSNFGVRHVASQRFVFTNINMFVFFLTRLSFILLNKKDAQRNLAPNGPYESPWTPIFDHLVQFWIMSVPKQPPLRLKPANRQASSLSQKVGLGLLVWTIPNETDVNHKIQYVTSIYLFPSIWICSNWIDCFFVFIKFN